MVFGGLYTQGHYQCETRRFPLRCNFFLHHINALFSTPNHDMHIPPHNSAGREKNNRNLLRGIVERILAVRENLVIARTYQC